MIQPFVVGNQKPFTVLPFYIEKEEGKTENDIENQKPVHMFTIGLQDESKQEIISGSELGWEVSITDIDDNTSLILNQIFDAGKQDISTEPVFEHEGIVSSAVQIYNASANISTLGNYFDFIDTGTRYWEQNLKLVWSTT